jgi:hypothetical protein
MKKFYESSNLSWWHGFLPVDAVFMSPDASGQYVKKTLAAGTLVRQYSGNLSDTLQSPAAGKKDVYWTEVAPDTGEFWLAYKASPQTTALVKSAVYQADNDARDQRMGWMQIDPETLLLPEVKGLTTEDLSTIPPKPRKPDYRKLTPQEIIDAANSVQSAGDFPWWLVIVGIGGVWYYSRKSRGEA